jgi:hypothetical protein
MMTWEEKLMALKALCPTHLEMRAPGNWYVSAHGRETQRPGDDILVGAYGNGKTPEAAVEDDWRQVTARECYVVLNAMVPERRRRIRWNGFMWEETIDPAHRATA